MAERTALQTTSVFNVTNGEQLLVVCQNPEIHDIINSYEEQHYSIDIQEAIKTLTSVSDMLLLAYAGSKNFPCSTDVLRLLSKYQDLVKHSVSTTKSFMNTSLKALKYHKIMLNLAEKGPIDKTFSWVDKCTALATEMAEKCNVLMSEADNLVVLSGEALFEANNNRATSEAEKKKIEEKTKRDKLEKVKREQHRIGIQARIVELDKEIKKQEEIESKNDKYQTIMSFLPFTGRAEKKFGSKASKAQICAQESKQLKMELMKGDSENNAEMAAIVCSLMNLRDDKDELKKAVKSIELSIKSLGKVKNAFYTAKIFWEQIGNHSKALKEFNLGDLVDPDTKEFLDELKSSGYNWLLLGKMNFYSDKGLKEVNERVDWAMGNLPQQDEVESLMDKLSSGIMDGIEESNKKITKYQSALEE